MIYVSKAVKEALKKLGVSIVLRECYDAIELVVDNASGDGDDCIAKIAVCDESTGGIWASYNPKHKAWNDKIDALYEAIIAKNEEMREKMELAC
jgi:hypothetical protein